MDTYIILRRSGWSEIADVAEATARSTAEGDRVPDEVCWIRSYVVAEADGRLGTMCVYEAAGPEALRRHAEAAGMPIDEIVKVVDTVVVTADPPPGPSGVRRG